MDPARAPQLPVYTTQAVFPDLPNATGSASHQTAQPQERRESASRRQRRRQNHRESDTDSSASNSSESEDDSWTRWEGLRSAITRSPNGLSWAYQRAELPVLLAAAANQCLRPPLIGILILWVAAMNIISAGKCLLHSLLRNLTADSLLDLSKLSCELEPPDT